MTTPRMQSLKAVGALTLASLLWAASFVAFKIAMQAYAPLFVVFARLFLGALLLGALIRRSGTSGHVRRDIRPLLFMALCEPCLYFVFEANALKYTQASQAAMITALLPLMVSAAAAFVLKERLGVKKGIGLFLAVAGVVMISLTGTATEDAPNPVLGNILEILAMAAATGYIVTAKSLSGRHSPLFLTAVQTFVGTVFFSPVLFFSPLPTSFPLLPTLAVAFLAYGATFLAFTAYNYGVRETSASGAAVFINLIPVFTMAMSYFALGERLVPTQYAGAVVVFAGVYLSAAPQRQKRDASS